MSTEVWFRNPDNYIRELVEVGAGNIAWDRGMLVKKSIDPDKHASLYFGRAIPWRALVIGDQGTAEIDAEHSMGHPKAVYPTWRYGDDASLLAEIVERPIGMDRNLCMDMDVPADERPIYGQDHRVVITDIPNATSGPGRKFLRFLKELQEDYPDCKIHVHGLYSFRIAFGMGFASADFEPRTAAQKGKVHLPSGREEKYERAAANPQWITTLGFKPVDLAVPRNRCMYNIKSAMWAGENYDKLYKFRAVGGGAPVDADSSDDDFSPTTTRTHLSVSVKSKPGDGFHCDTCSLAGSCKYNRDGAVCSVPGAEPAELAKFFRTRDSGSIIDGLGILMQAGARRLERGMAEEEDFGLDPEVTKILGQLYDQGVKLAKLVDPSLTKPGVQVNVGPGGAAAIQTGNPRQFVAAAVAELRRQGVTEITPELIAGMLEGMGNSDSAQRSLSGTVIEHEERSA